jgi:hypothetical protein
MILIFARERKRKRGKYPEQPDVSRAPVRLNATDTMLSLHMEPMPLIRQKGSRDRAALKTCYCGIQVSENAKKIT